MKNYYLKRLQVKNFKSFEEIDIEFNKFNVIIGPNAAGKSNFLEIFQFLSDAISKGLKNAVELHGGINYVRNFLLKNDEIRFDLNFSSDKSHWLQYYKVKSSKRHKIFTDNFQYSFVIKITNNNDYEILDESLNFKCIIILNADLNKDKRKQLKADLSHIRHHDSIQFAKKINTELDSIIPDQKLFFAKEIHKKSLILPSIAISEEIPYTLKDFFTKINVYDFEPKLIKNSNPIISNKQMRIDGSNLSLILNDVLDKNKKSFYAFLEDFLPFIKNIEIDVKPYRYIDLLVEEKFSDNRIPAWFSSDGTVMIMALLTVVYFHSNYITFIEEPERNIHPKLLTNLIRKIREATKNNQIFLTTHNPFLLRNLSIDDLLLIIRSDKGYSTISKPKNNTQVKEFLKDSVDIEDLFTSRLIERS